MYSAVGPWPPLERLLPDDQSALPCNARERASGAYGTASYFTATVAFDFVPMRVLPTALFALTTYWMIGLRPGLGRAATFLLLLVLTNLTGAAMNMAIGARHGRLGSEWGLASGSRSGSE